LHVRRKCHISAAAQKAAPQKKAQELFPGFNENPLRGIEIFFKMRVAHNFVSILLLIKKNLILEGRLSSSFTRSQSVKIFTLYNILNQFNAQGMQGSLIVF